MQALRRADQVETAEGNVTRDWYAPIVADAEAGFGGPLNAYEMMKARSSAPTSCHFPMPGCLAVNFAWLLIDDINRLLCCLAAFDNRILQ